MGVVASGTPKLCRPSAPLAGPERRTTVDFPFPSPCPPQQILRPGSPAWSGGCEKTQRSKIRSWGARRIRDLVVHERGYRVPFCFVCCIQHI